LPKRIHLACTLLAAVLSSSGGLRGDEGPAAAERGRSGGPLRRLEYEGLWPFYSREIYDDQSTRLSSLLGLVRVEREPGGDHHHHVLPFYCTSLSGGGADRQLALGAFLYLRRRSPEEDHDLALPFFARWRSGERRHLVAWPLLHAAREPGALAFDIIPTLYRRGRWDETVRERLGVPLALAFFERSAAPGREAWTIANLFPLLGEETRFGLPAAKLVLEDQAWHAHLFPLFLARADRAEERRHFHTPLAGAWSIGADEAGIVIPPLLAWWFRGADVKDFNLLWPLVRYASSPERDHFRLVPLAIYRRLPGSEAAEIDLYLPVLLSHHGRGPERWDLDAPWPLLHLSRSGKKSALRALPFFDRSARPEWRDLGIGTLLYRRHEELASEELTQWAPFPLVHWKLAPRETEVNVLWPLVHYSRDEEDLAIRALPFFDRARGGGKESLGIGTLLYRQHREGETDSRWAAWPLVHWKSSPEEELSWALPFYVRREARSERERSAVSFLAPSWYRFVEERLGAAGDWEEARRATLLWPLFGRSRRFTPAGEDGAPEREELGYSTLWPFFRLERVAEGPPAAAVTTTVHAPWPLLRHRSEPEGFAHHILPFLYAGRSPARAYAYLYPFVSLEKGPEARRSFWHHTSIVQWFDDGRERRFDIFPLLFSWSRAAGGEAASVRGPLYWFHYSRTPGRGWFHLLPLGFGAWEEEKLQLGVFPFYYRRDHGKERIHYWTAARFLFLWNRLQNEEVTYRSFLWKALEHGASRAGDYEFRLFHRLVVNREVEGQREVVVNPVFAYFSDERKRKSSWSILRYVYRKDVEDGVETRRLFFVPLARREG
jgi:hypothetical protein